MYSDHSEKKVKNKILEGGYIANPKSQNHNSSSSDYVNSGFVYNITVTYDSSKYYVITVLKK